MDTSAVVAAFRGVSHRIGSHPVLRNISLEVSAGQTVCIIGESGCGKTVSLKLLVGLMTPTAGEALLFGSPLASLGVNELRAVRRRIGFLFQGSALFDSLSVAENIAYPMRVAGKITGDDLPKEVIARLEEVGLNAAAMTKFPSELSGGMQKRVALARALSTNPELMCYDEPTTGLDPVMTEVINELIVQTRQRRPLTSIVVTHELRTIRRVADRVVMLSPLTRLGPDDPQVIFDGTPDALFDSSDPRVRRFLA
ncbi:ABC transporter ATP-binding protein [Zavarzinella formosa]|uniref:ABC transporter ATP-binding protein n=1 Tax=Zavarzinella formosa TaxID=360055 RepID=UPI000311E13A|nr:ATP-binding cassette domain-containing protein [Zavarzinella formosa]